MPFESGHADQDEPDVVAVEVVAEVFQALGFQPVCFVDDEQFGVPCIVEVEHQLEVVVGVERERDKPWEAPCPGPSVRGARMGAMPDTMQPACGAGA